MSELGEYMTSATQFIVEVDGEEIGTFKELEGLSVTVETEDLVEGGQNQFVHRLPCRMTWPNLVLRRGLIQTDALFDWVNKTSGDGFATAGNKLTRCTGAVGRTLRCRCRP